MSLIRCIECGKEISDKALSCPNCGFTIIQKNKRIFVVGTHIGYPCPVCNVDNQTFEVLESTVKNTIGRCTICYNKTDINYEDNIVLSENEYNDIAAHIFSNDIDKSIRKIISFTNCTEEEAYNYVIREQESLKKMQELSGLKVGADYKPSQHQLPNQVTCPFCQSTNVHKISATERAASIVGLGIFSKKINKSFKCKNCGGTF